MSMKSARSLLKVIPLLLLLLTHSIAPVAAQSATAGISGRVLNGTSSGEAVGGVAVTVSMLDGPNKRVVSTVTTDSTGAYLVGNLQTGAGLAYFASATYQGVTFTSEPVAAVSGRDMQTDVTVYEAASDSTKLTVTRQSIVLAGADRQSGLLTIVESYHIRNDSPAAYVGDASSGHQQSLQLPLFQGARSLAPLDGFTLDDAIQTTRGFALTSPVLPGDSVVSFTYDVPFQSQSLALRRAVAYRTDLTELILPGSVQVTSPQLSAHGQVQLGGRSFDTIQATNLAAGSPIVVDLSGLPAQSRSLVRLDSLFDQVALVGLIICAIGATVVFHRRLARRVSLERLLEERSAVLQAVAKLDDLAEGGSERLGDYGRRRRILMKKLLSIDALLREHQLVGGLMRPKVARTANQRLISKP
jgi:hypothetical protein